MVTGRHVTSGSANGGMKRSQLAPWLEDSDWICCIRCCARPCVSKTSLFVGDCGHIYCGGCKETVQRSKCIKCQKTGVKFLLIDDNVKAHPLVGDFFQDPMELMQRIVKMLEFQQKHMKRYWQHQKKSGEPSIDDLRKEYGDLAGLSMRELRSGYSKKVAFYNQEEQRLKAVCSQSKLLFDEIVTLVRQMKGLGWNEQNLAWEEGGCIINGVELLQHVSTLLGASADLLKNGGMEIRSGILTTTQNAHSNHSVHSSPSSTKKLLPPPPLPPRFPHHLKAMPTDTQTNGGSPMSWQPYVSPNGRGMPPPRLPPSRKLAPPTATNTPGGVLTSAMLARHQQTTPTSVGMVTAARCPSSAGSTPMEYTSSHFMQRRKLPTPERGRASPSPSRAATHGHRIAARSRPQSAGVRSASPSPLTTPQKTPSSLKRISIRGPPSGGKMGTTPGGIVTPDSSLYKLIQEKRGGGLTPQSSQSPSMRGTSSTTFSGGSSGRSRRSHPHHPHSRHSVERGGVVRGRSVPGHASHRRSDT